MLLSNLQQLGALLSGENVSAAADGVTSESCMQFNREPLPIDSQIDFSLIEKKLFGNEKSQASLTLSGLSDFDNGLINDTAKQNDSVILVSNDIVSITLEDSEMKQFPEDEDENAAEVEELLDIDNPAVDGTSSESYMQFNRETFPVGSHMNFSLIEKKLFGNEKSQDSLTLSGLTGFSNEHIDDDASNKNHLVTSVRNDGAKEFLEEEKNATETEKQSLTKKDNFPANTAAAIINRKYSTDTVRNTRNYINGAGTYHNIEHRNDFVTAAQYLQMNCNKPLPLSQELDNTQKTWNLSGLSQLQNLNSQAEQSPDHSQQMQTIEVNAATTQASNNSFASALLDEDDFDDMDYEHFNQLESQHLQKPEDNKKDDAEKSQQNSISSVATSTNPFDFLTLEYDASIVQGTDNTASKKNNIASNNNITHQNRRSSSENLMNNMPEPMNQCNQLDHDLITQLRCVQESGSQSSQHLPQNNLQRNSNTEDSLMKTPDFQEARVSSCFKFPETPLRPSPSNKASSEHSSMKILDIQQPRVSNFKFPDTPLRPSLSKNANNRDSSMKLLDFRQPRVSGFTFPDTPLRPSLSQNANNKASSRPNNANNEMNMSFFEFSQNPRQNFFNFNNNSLSNSSRNDAAAVDDDDDDDDAVMSNPIEQQQQQSQHHSSNSPIMEFELPSAAADNCGLFSPFLENKDNRTQNQATNSQFDDNNYSSSDSTLIPTSVKQLYDLIKRKYSDFSFVYALSAQLCQDRIPMDCFVTFKMSLLLSLASIGPNLNRPPIPIIAMGHDVYTINYLMTNVGQLATRFLGPCDDHFKTPNRNDKWIYADPILLAKDGIFYIADWSCLKVARAEKIFKDIECSSVSIEKSKQKYPLETAIWSHWRTYKFNAKDQQTFNKFMKIFGLPIYVDDDNHEAMVAYTLEQSSIRTYESTIDNLSISYDDMKSFLQRVSQRSVDFLPDAEQLLQRYFIACRAARPDCLAQKSYTILKQFSESFAKLSLRHDVLCIDVISAIIICEHSIEHIFGTGIDRPPPHFGALSFVGHVDKYLKEFEKWLDKFIENYYNN